MKNNPESQDENKNLDSGYLNEGKILKEVKFIESKAIDPDGTMDHDNRKSSLKLMIDGNGDKIKSSRFHSPFSREYPLWPSFYHFYRPLTLDLSS